MTVYVDDMYKSPMGRLGRMKMSHMIADSTEELLAMADKIGITKKWIQDAGTPREHFDVSLGKRNAAIANGAVEITWREMGRMMQKRRMPDRALGHLPEDDWAGSNWGDN